MKKERSKFPVKNMARALQVSRSGFYRWISRKPSARAINNEIMRPIVLAAFENSRKTYGPRRLQSELASNGITIGRDHIYRISNELNLQRVQIKKFKATTNSQHSLPVAPNLLEQKFTETAPGKVWGTDITYIPTDEGWLYLAGVKDFGTKEIVGYAVVFTLEQGTGACRPRQGSSLPQATEWLYSSLRQREPVLWIDVPGISEKLWDDCVDVPERKLLR